MTSELLTAEGIDAELLRGWSIVERWCGPVDVLDGWLWRGTIGIVRARVAAEGRQVLREEAVRCALARRRLAVHRAMASDFVLQSVLPSVVSMRFEDEHGFVDALAELLG